MSKGNFFIYIVTKICKYIYAQLKSLYWHYNNKTLLLTAGQFLAWFHWYIDDLSWMMSYLRFCLLAITQFASELEQMYFGEQSSDLG